MIGSLILILVVWCAYNTLSIQHNSRQDRRGDIIDKCAVQVMRIHCNRLDKHDKRLNRIEEELGIKYKEEEE